MKFCPAFGCQHRATRPDGFCSRYHAAVAQTRARQAADEDKQKEDDQ